ncbi:MAG: type II toxin-antitoxin system YafQ family toxin [Pseudomonadota bacterium]|nr:type II toxin-antitoxin system YafQ family toxin [Pseudomonadota bacterium]
MRTLKLSSAFKRDMRRELKGKHAKTLAVPLLQAVHFLVDDVPLPATFLDHQLKGDWRGFRECHLKPDLLLVYKKADDGSVQLLQLIRLGSHAELFNK